MVQKVLLIVFACLFANFLSANDEKVIYDAVLKNIHNDVLSSEISSSVHKPTLYTLVLKNRQCLQDLYLSHLLKEGRLRNLNYVVKDEKYNLECNVTNMNQGLLSIGSLVRLCDFSLYSNQEFNLFEMTTYKYEFPVLVRIQFSEIKIDKGFAVVVA